MTPAASRPRRASRVRRSHLNPPSRNRSNQAAGRSSDFSDLIAVFTDRWEQGQGQGQGQGQPVAVEEYLPGLTSDAAVELIYHEFCLAESAQARPDPAAYLARFPEHAEALERMFALHEALSVGRLREMVDPSAHLPRAGDEIGPYRLLREMGRGAFARVFLAEQSDLGDRLVVVKVATRPSQEPTLLGRSRHPNIVEVLRHIDDPDSGLHLVCLPFLGGATLGAILEARRSGGADRHSARRLRPRSGRDFLADLDRASAPEYRATSGPRAARAELARGSHARAVAWVVARLAEALDHAQRRGVTHGDVKPSNILVTADGVPMLFDFNLAVDWHEDDRNRAPGDPRAGADRGGTLAYMAPERLRAMTESPAEGGFNPRFRCGRIALEATPLARSPPRGPCMPWAWSWPRR